MPDLKVSGRKLTDLEAYVLDTVPSVAQARALRHLEILVANHEASAMRAARDQWVAEKAVPRPKTTDPKDVAARAVAESFQWARDHEPALGGSKDSVLGPPPPSGPQRHHVVHTQSRAPVPRPRLPSRSGPSKKKAKAR